MKLYRILVIILIAIGLFLTGKALYDAISDGGAHFPIRCDSDVCRAIHPDGTLSSGTVERPAGVTK